MKPVISVVVRRKAGCNRSEFHRTYKKEQFIKENESKMTEVLSECELGNRFFNRTFDGSATSKPKDTIKWMVKITESLRKRT